jgi:hypothetical protein
MTRFAAALAVAVLASACSGGDDAVTTTATVQGSAETDDTLATTTTPVTTPPSTVSTTDPETTTTAPPVTEPPDPVTTTAASTQPDDDIHRSIIDAVIESWRVFNEAKLDPTDDDKVAALSEVRSGELLTASIDLISRYRFENRRSVTNDEFPATLVPDAETIQLTDDGSRATLESCRVNSNLSVEIGGNPDGTDRVVDDSVSVFIETAELELVDGRWIEVGGAIIERFEGATSCEG